MDKIFTVNEVAELLKVKPITVREMFRERRLRGFKMGKAWRTTEKLLQEDIAAWSRGEKPAPLTTMPDTMQNATRHAGSVAQREESASTPE